MLSLVFGCSSDPLESDAGGGGASGEAGSGSGGAAPDPRDYTDSPCYGQSRSTSVYDGQTHTQRTVQATCRAEGERSLVYVADDLFGGRVSQAAVNAFMHRFEVLGNAQSHRPDLGVLPTDEVVFGALDVSRFPGGKLPLFLIDSQGAGEGYLCSWCETPELHLDGILLAPLDGDAALSIAAHETFHVIHRGYDANERVWVDESLAQAAMAVNGFFTDTAWLSDFVQNPNVNWGPLVTDIAGFHYGAGLAFGTYLWEQGGPELMRAATAEPRDDWTGLDRALAETGEARSAFQMFMDMAVALYLDDPARGFGFESFDLEQNIARIPAELASNTARVEPYGLVYRTLNAEMSQIRVDGGTTVHARVVTDTDPPNIVEVPLGIQTSIPTPAVLILTATARTNVTFTLE
ncbi:MAG TPA: hypothetical protein VIM73_10025 [Polyangiaceae bacterium]